MLTTPTKSRVLTAMRIGVVGAARSLMVMRDSCVSGERSQDREPCESPAGGGAATTVCTRRIVGENPLPRVVRRADTGLMIGPRLRLAAGIAWVGLVIV